MRRPKYQQAHAGSLPGLIRACEMLREGKTADDINAFCDEVQARFRPTPSLGEPA